jgi:hypothetical protein
MITDELNTIFESVDSQLLSEDTKKAITSLIEEKVNQKVQERLTLELESVVKTQHEKFKKASILATEAIDKDHLGKIDGIVKILQKEHNSQLTALHGLHKKTITETALNHRSVMVEGVDRFLDAYIEKHLPREQIEEAAKNKYALKAIEEARKVLGIDTKFMTQNFKEALVDGKKQMDKLIHENAELKKRTVISESKKILAEKTANLPVEVSRFVKSRLDNKSAQYINENFDYVVDMYNRQEKTQKKSALLNENRQTFIVDRKQVVEEILKESAPSQHQVNHNLPMEDMYLSGLNYRK